MSAAVETALHAGRCAGRVEAIRAASLIVNRLLDGTTGKISRDDVAKAVHELQRLTLLASVDDRRWSR